MKAIETKSGKLCTGCAACAAVCPRKCIEMTADGEGFLRPATDRNVCADCGACERVCPVLNPARKRDPEKVYACRNSDESVRLSSSSGGLFSALAEAVVSRGGVVAGACFDKNWNVRHDVAETLEDLAKFRGSKYVQSEVVHIYPVVEKFLKEGRPVLFSGTPCQTAGMKNFLRKDRDNLILVDFICHGVPSSKVWRKYLRDEVGLLQSGGTVPEAVRDVNFRNKEKGWREYRFVLSFLSDASADGKGNSVSHSAMAWEHPYMKGFLYNLYLRPSCYSCPVKHFAGGGDITMADAWGIENYIPEWDDDRGVSLCIPHSAKGERLLKETRGVEVREVGSGIICRHNDAAFRSARRNRRTGQFYRLMDRGIPFGEIIARCFPPASVWDRLLWSLNKRLKKLWPEKF